MDGWDAGWLMRGTRNETRLNLRVAVHRVHLIAPLNYTGKDYGMRSFVCSKWRPRPVYNILQ